MKTIKNILIEAIEAKQSSGELREILRRFGYTYFTALLELIDNAISAKPDLIRILRKSNSIIIRDNGTGIKKENYRRLVSLGNGGKSRTSLLGKNGTGFTASSLFLSNSVVVVTKVSGGDAVSLVPLFSDDQVLVNRPNPHEKNEIDEVRELKDHGTSIILSDLRMSNEDSNKLMADLEANLGLYYCFFMNGEDAIDIMVDRKSIKPFNPSCPDYVARRASSNDIVSVIELSKLKAVTFNDGNTSIKGKMAVAHVPYLNLLKRKASESVEGIYPQCIKDNDGSYGIYFYRYGRFMGVLTFKQLGIDTGNNLRSLRVLIFLESDIADRIFFDSHVNKSIRTDIPSGVKRSISSAIAPFLAQSEKMRSDARTKFNSMKKIDKHISGMVDLIKKAYKTVTKKDSSYKTPCAKYKSEMLKLVKVSV